MKMEPIEVVIETVAGSAAKYKFDNASNSFRLKKFLPLGMAFPYHFGFLPGTRGEDGDPLDAMVISEYTFFTGARLQCRLIGAIQAYQLENGNKVRNDRYFFVPEGSMVFKHISALNDFGTKHNNQLKDFFKNYNRAENKQFIAGKTVSAISALLQIKAAQKGSVNQDTHQNPTR
jgi:inorganic pyrophosphatase